MKWWPFLLIRKRDHRLLTMENATLRDALRNANQELAKHRRLIAGLRIGDPEITKALERARA